MIVILGIRMTNTSISSFGLYCLGTWPFLGEIWIYIFSWSSWIYGDSIDTESSYRINRSTSRDQILVFWDSRNVLCSSLWRGAGIIIILRLTAKTFGCDSWSRWVEYELNIIRSLISDSLSSVAMVRKAITLYSHVYFAVLRCAWDTQLSLPWAVRRSATNWRWACFLNTINSCTSKTRCCSWAIRSLGASALEHSGISLAVGKGSLLSFERSH